MSMPFAFDERITLYGRESISHEERISHEDAVRQERTARHILKRLNGQPGLVLADEVGMGKTFVALAVAVSVALADPKKRPVVVMVPPSLKEKWPTDWEFFRERCLPANVGSELRAGRAERGLDFLKLLDDPLKRRRSIIFLTHGAMSRGLVGQGSGWVKLALLRQAIRYRRDARELRAALSRFAGRFLRMGWVDSRAPKVWGELLQHDPEVWLEILQQHGIDPEHDNDPETDDDPVPEAIRQVLPGLDLDQLYTRLQGVPRRASKTLSQRLQKLRYTLKDVLREQVWPVCLERLRFHLPLLILDEAHHLKNPATKLASLFRVAAAHEDMQGIHHGPLGGVFERMLFLTATPFQLGHGELCSVLERFGGIRWHGRRAPPQKRCTFMEQVRTLREALDRAQESALALDKIWGRLKPEDVCINGLSPGDVESWWAAARNGAQKSAALRQTFAAFTRTRASMRAAETLLQPWVIRHLKSRTLPAPHESTPRRRRMVGREILLQRSEKDARTDGLSVDGEALLPFLLAARATSHQPHSRPLFAEGLASSFEAFRHTRRLRLAREKVATESPLDLDDDVVVAGGAMSQATRWYLDQLDRVLPDGSGDKKTCHPKLAATVQRTLALWKQREKVVVFCHYVMTGRILRQRISEAVNTEIQRLAASQLAASSGVVGIRLERISNRFHAPSPIRRACDVAALQLLAEFPRLREHRDDLIEVVRRNLRTPAMLVRFFPLHRHPLGESAMREALGRRDKSGLSLEDLLRSFFKFLAERCGAEDRRRTIEAILGIQTGAHHGEDAAQVENGEGMGSGVQRNLLPNVRLVNGATRHETRRRIMLAFNTPFMPDILIASSVMAEGVDLHLHCRHTIHHDLCWNPSTLEQRTGRLDRIGAKAERCGRSILVYMPFIAETQDEKMYRVVMDRERWFSVVMGEQYSIDALSIERQAARVPFPQSAARELAFRLSVPDED